MNLRRANGFQRDGKGSVCRPPVPAVTAAAGEKASRRFLEFFTAEIRNRNTRLAYARAVSPFLDWCEARGRELHEIDPVMVAAYVEQLAVTPPWSETTAQEQKTMRRCPRSIPTHTWQGR